MRRREVGADHEVRSTMATAKKKTSSKKTTKPKSGGVGASGSKAKPKTGEGGGKWPGGGKKGEDE